MHERFRKLGALLTNAQSVPLLGNIDAHMKRLPPGDRLIAVALGGIVIAAGVLGLYAFIHSFLVAIPAKGGSVTEGVLGSPRFVNPLLALSDADRDLSALTFAGLMGIDESGELRPVLAASYDISDDGKVYTFVLKEGLTFSDGAPITAEDVVFTVEKAQDPGLKSPELANWSNILAEAVDARTVRFTLGKAYAPFLENATLGILPAHLWRELSNEEFPFSPLMTKPVGAGPFKVEQVRRNSAGVITSLTLSAFSDYALGRPYLGRMKFVFFQRETELADALRHGRVDSAYGVAEEGALRAPFAQVFGVFFNSDQNPVFLNKEVRHALSVATDRTRITEELFGGYASPLFGPVPPGSLSSPDTTVETREERLLHARAILEDGGWVFDEEASQWSHAKKSLSLSVTLRTSNVPELKAVASSVREDWEALGVPVSIELYEPGDLMQNVIRPRRYDALLFGMVVGREQDLYAFWHSSQRNDPGLNVALYANRSVDELLAELRTNESEEERAEALTKLNDLIAEDYPAVFTHTPDFVYAAPEGVHGIALTEIASPSDRFATVASWYKNTESVWPLFAK